MKNSIATLVRVVLVFAVLAVAFAKVYDIGLNRPPLRYAEIPEKTKQYIKDLGDTPGLGLTISDIGPFDWENEKDLGSEEWDSEEDGNFVVYYMHDKEAVWQGYAMEVLLCARENVALLKELFGKYYYADDMNGRRLAIYLPDDEYLYANTVRDLLGREGYDVKSASGIIITEIGPLGCLTRGIVLNPICFDKENMHNNNHYARVLKHEMAHYVFLTSLNYGKEIQHYQWIIEGVADYFSLNRDNAVFGNDSIDFIMKKCKLNDEFPLEMNSAYWAGESFFSYLERTYGRNYVKYFLQQSYEKSTDGLILQEFSSADTLHMNWVDDLRFLQMDSVMLAMSQDSLNVAAK